MTIISSHYCVSAWLAAVCMASGADIVVSPPASIQSALNSAQAGDTVYVRTGVYYEKLEFPRSGNAASGWITLKAYAGETPALDGTGTAGEAMIAIYEKSFIRVAGLELRNNTGVSNGGGIWIEGACQNIEILTNTIHAMHGTNAMAVAVYGTNAIPATNIVIRGNQIYDCEPAVSETIAMNGNINGFEVSLNSLRDVNNIGIVFIGGEPDISPYGVCRNGVCRGNVVLRARSNYGDGYAAGIYVDGGKDIVLERNLVCECDVGMEIGAENAGITATGIVARSNIVFNNDKAGLAFGGYEQSRGRVQGCRFLNNHCFKNDTLSQGNGELWIQWASDNTVENNIFYCGAQGKLINSQEGNQDNFLDYNLWFHESGAGQAAVDWNGVSYSGYENYRAATGQDSHSQFANPLFADATALDLHPATNSPARDAGNPATSAVGETDFDGLPRVIGDRIDIGAYEAQDQDRADDAERLYTPAAPMSAQNPAFSPDGGSLVFTLFHNGYNAGPAGIYRMNAGSGAISGILDEPDQNSVNLPGTCWNGILNRIVFASDRLERQEIWSIAPDGSSPARVTVHESGYSHEPTFSPDGEWIVFEWRSGDETPGSILKIRANGASLTTLIDSTATGYDDRQPNWSPAGDRILFQRRVPGSDNWDIYTMNTDGADVRQVTTDPASDTDASWSPDAAWIVFSSDFEGLPHPNIFIIPSEGGVPMRVTESGNCEDSEPSWSPDGKWIAFESRVANGETTPSALWRIAVSAPTLPPTGVAATDGTLADRVEVSWNSDPGAQAYEVWRSPRNSTGTAVKLAEHPLTFYADTNTVRGKSCFYWVKTKYAGATSWFSAPARGRRMGLPDGYDSDGISDLAVFDSISGNWFIRSVSGSLIAWDIPWGWPGAYPVPGDFNGDGLSDLAVFDPASGAWYVLSSDQTTVLAWAVQFGSPGALPVPGDFNGDGASDLAVFDSISGLWYVAALDAGEGSAFVPTSKRVGTTADKSGFGVQERLTPNTEHRTPIASPHLLNTEHCTLNTGSLRIIAWGVPWGWPGAYPVPGDFNGDGASDLAVFDSNPGLWYVAALTSVQSSVSSIQTTKSPNTDNRKPNTTPPAPETLNTEHCTLNTGSPRIIAWGVPWGWPGAYPVPGDFNGDGISDLAVFDSISGNWFIRSVSGSLIAWAIPWGWPGALPVPGDFNGDGISDLAVFDTGSGNWFIRSVSGAILAWTVPWGWAGAVPVAGAKQ